MSEKIDTLLEEIAKILLVTGEFTQNTGLYYGQSGAVIFLYNYYQYTENETYANFADELILSITGHLNEKEVHYSNGLSGIAWAIDYLAEYDFIDFPSGSEIFSNVDRSILKINPLVNQGMEASGYASYLLTRLRNYSKNDQGDLTQLMFLERLIAHIDEIDMVEGNSEILSKKDVFGHMEGTNITNLSNTVERYAMSTIVLKKAAGIGIYEQISRQLIRVLAKKTVHLVKLICLYMDEKAPKTYQHIGELNQQLLLCFNAGLQLGEPAEEIVKLFLEASVKLEHASALAIVRDKEQLNAPLEVTAITLLNRINIVLKNSLISEVATSKINRLIDFLYIDSNLVNPFTMNPTTLNIGVTGLAGLGLLLLDHVLPAKGDWERALLYN